MLTKAGHTHFRGENSHEWQQIREIRESFLPRKFPATRYANIIIIYASTSRENNAPAGLYSSMLC